MGLHTALLLILIILLYFIRKNTLLNVILLAASIPFETYVNWKIGFTFKPAQLFAISAFVSMALNGERILPTLKSQILFLFLLLAALLSLINAPREILFGGYHGSIRMIFNLGFLYFIAYVVSISIKDVKALKDVMLAYVTAIFISVVIETIRAHINGWEDIGYLGFTDAYLRRGGYTYLPSIIYPRGYLRLSPIITPPNHYAAMLMVGLTFITTLGVYSQIKLHRVIEYALPILFTICFFGFMLTFSRGSWASYIAALVIILFFLKGREWYRTALYGGISLIVTSILLLNIYPKNLHAFLERAAPRPVLNVIFSTGMPSTGPDKNTVVSAPAAVSAALQKNSSNAKPNVSVALQKDSSNAKPDGSTALQKDSSDANPDGSAALQKDSSNAKPDGSTAVRVSAIKDAFEAFKAHPLIGSGWATNFKPHNVFLQILCESGILGIAAFLGFFIYIFYNLYYVIRKSEGELKALAIGITAGLAGTMFYFNTDTVLYEIQVWLFVGLGMLIIRLAGRKAKQEA